MTYQLPTSLQLQHRPDWKSCLIFNVSTITCTNTHVCGKMWGNKRRKIMAVKPLKVNQDHRRCMGCNTSNSNSYVITACVVAEMAGRPQARKTIVPAQDVMAAPAHIAAERWRLGTVFGVINETPACLQWVARCRLIHNDVQCTRCGQPASLVARTDRLNGVQWICRRCHFSQSVRHGSFFERVNCQYRRWWWWCTAGVASKHCRLPYNHTLPQVVVGIVCISAWGCHAEYLANLSTTCCCSSASIGTVGVPPW